MSTYRVELAPRACRDIRKLPKAAQAAMVARLDSLGGEPRPKDCTKLAGVKNLHRVREGDYRIIYAVYDDLMVVLALSASHRRDAYGHLPELERVARALASELRADLP